MKLNFRKMGEGPALVILHGLFGASDNWQSVAKQLSESFTLYLLDARNHGQSPHSDEMNYPVMAEDVEEFFVSENIPSSDLMGHSMGGKIAMFFAVKYPERVKRLVVVDIAPKAYPVHHEKILEGFAAVDFDKVSSRKEADAMMAPCVPELGVRQFLLKNLARLEDGNYAWKANIKVISGNIEKMGEGLSTDSHYDGSTLFINGENSDYIRPEDRDAIRDIFPSARVETITDAGHWVHAERPERFLEVLTEFLQ